MEGNRVMGVTHDYAIFGRSNAVCDIVTGMVVDEGVSYVFVFFLFNVVFISVFF